MTSPNMPYTCIQCGQVLGTGGGRCPYCGAMQPEVTRPAEQRPAPYVAAAAAPAKKSPVALIVAAGLVVAIGGIAFAALMFSGSEAPEPAPTTAPVVASVAPPPVASAAPAEVRVDRVLGPATTKARGWDKDAQLVRIDAQPVADGAVDVEQGGKIEILFGRATGRLGPGATIGTEQFVVTIDTEGTSHAPKDGDATKAVASPICTMAEAWRKMVASGVPANSRVRMTYEHSAKHDRSVWRSTIEGDESLTRTIDGMKCSILVR